MAKQTLSRLGRWCSRMFAVECDPSSDSVYFALTKTPHTRQGSERQEFEKIFGRAKSFSLHVCTEDRIQRAKFYEDIKCNTIPGFSQGCRVFDVFSFHPDVKNSALRGFLVRGVADIQDTGLFEELVRNPGLNVCTYVLEEETQQWWQHLWSKAEDGRMVVVDKYCLVPAEKPEHHPSTLNIINSDVFYKFGDACKVLRECSKFIPESKELLELVDQGLPLKRDGRFPVVVIEGLDATGKTTLTHSLTDTLNATLLQSPPQCLSPWRPRFDSEPALLRRAFYALGNYITAGQINRASAHAPVIVDRYWHSTAAYGIATAVSGRVDNLPSPGSEVYRWPVDLLRPDLVLLLTVSPEERIRRLRFRGAEKTREEAELEANDRFRNKVEQAYKRIEDPACVVVDASPPPDQVLQQVLHLIKNKCHL
ncbi:UMP-CMP kinase 2, mitochondrial [Megalops cyprinoides]|uniref:UMP-CMP kinase 2, mitochondrial n=1 Tax=Megalops cyprinoides TaxID=118141 RepID=UPI00186515A7|nr:UMP-CMP kinase 2, mitochondrial [Megalops cyprinoides]